MSTPEEQAAQAAAQAAPPAAEPAASQPTTVEPTVEELQAQNQALREKLIADNAKLQEAVATIEQATQGLTDEDVRRAEHPDEFAHETASPSA